ncbi:XdhC family protein [Cohnella zeiphila]|uniref:XdhC family protein n=1 Tax=Cohnella zeiphila TaxID=2761120 RepID=A0A7X0SL60_9BACL|nr:XdhC/CoxI family protein [Cohnella zeiphila]MBB6732028.1 XdhC family protein [Cohnella zeiphila]
MDTETVFALAERWPTAAALATLIEVRGHSYRKAGASMLLAANGEKAGSISPGCLEADLAERAGGVLAGNRHAVVEYDLRPEEDIVWGEEIGCGGMLRVLVEPLTDELRRALGEVVRLMRGGEGARLERRESGGRLVYAAEPAGPSPAPDPGGNAGGESGAWEDGTGKGCASGLFYASLHLPRERLVIFGAGDEAIAVDELARSIGFRTAVADWRPALCGPERFPKSATFVGDAESIVAELRVGRGDYVMIAGHNLRRDREMVARVLPLGPAYLGIVGSASRVRRLLDGMAPPPFVRAPIGLPLGAEGAQEIAVSVAAELIAWRRRLRVSSAGRREA